MFKKAKIFFIHTITPLHAGSGEDLGIVDLPIQRERHTGFPKIEGSSLKGAMREVFEDLVFFDEKENKYKLVTDSPSITKLNKLETDTMKLDDEWKRRKKDSGDEENVTDKNNKNLLKYHKAISLSFGPEDGDAHAGALGFTDARLLLFPVKSMKGVFAWITCPSVLERFKQDLDVMRSLSKHSQKQEDDFIIPTIENGKCVVSKNLCEVKVNENKVILEEYTFDIDLGKIADDIADKIFEFYPIKKLKEKLVILSDDDFKDFVNLSTEVITRTKISAKTGTVEQGALWTEEYLPAETVLYSLALATPVFNEDKGVFQKSGKKEEEDRVIDFFKAGCPEHMQIGGNTTIGKGIVKIIKNSNNNGGQNGK